MYRLALVLLLVGCSQSAATTCTSSFSSKHDILNNSEQAYTCNCSCPKTTDAVSSTLGLAGGVLSLASYGN
jgi:hypothetical protein